MPKTVHSSVSKAGHLSLRINPHLKDRFISLAKKRKLTATDLMTMLIKQELDRVEAGQNKPK